MSVVTSDPSGVHNGIIVHFGTYLLSDHLIYISITTVAKQLVTVYKAMRCRIEGIYMLNA